MDRLKIWDYQAIAKGPEVQGEHVVSVPDGGMRPHESETQWRLRMLLKHLQTLAADADAVLRAYPSQVAAVDELVNGYSHYLQLSQSAVDEGLITEDAMEQARAVDAQIDRMSKKHDARLWSDEGLRGKFEWKVVRQKAKDALEAMGYELEPPPPGSM